MKRILITRPRAQANSFAEALTSAGFEPVFFPVIEIRPMNDNAALDSALQKLATYDWVVFTSVNGVDAVWDRLVVIKLVPAQEPPQTPLEHLGSHLPENVKVVAIGPKTAEALRSRGVVPSFVPEEYVAEAIMPGLGDLDGRWVLLPRAETARKALPEMIVQAGGVAHEIAVYRTLPAAPDTDGLAALKSGVDVVTLTSPSTVHNFVALARSAGLDPHALPGNPKFACIGPVTAVAVREEGLPVDVVAEEYTSEGLIKVISKFCL